MFKTLLKTIKGTKEILRGMFTVGKYAFRPSVTLEYPEKKYNFNSRFKGRPALTVDENGELLCMGCKACQKVCPCSDLIYIETSKDENKKLKVDKFTIDLGRCIFCGNCSDACSKGAIIMSQEYELSDYSRESLVFDKEKLALSPEKSKKALEELARDV